MTRGTAGSGGGGGGGERISSCLKRKIYGRFMALYQLFLLFIFAVVCHFHYEFSLRGTFRYYHLSLLLPFVFSISLIYDLVGRWLSIRALQCD